MIGWLSSCEKKGSPESSRPFQRDRRTGVPVEMFTARSGCAHVPKQFRQQMRSQQVQVNKVTLRPAKPTRLLTLYCMVSLSSVRDSSSRAAATRMVPPGVSYTPRLFMPTNLRTIVRRQLRNDADLSKGGSLLLKRSKQTASSDSTKVFNPRQARSLQTDKSGGDMNDRKRLAAT